MLNFLHFSKETLEEPMQNSDERVFLLSFALNKMSIEQWSFIIVAIVETRLAVVNICEPLKTCAKKKEAKPVYGQRCY